MTERDLSTLLREHSRDGEPSFPPPHEAISRGRRRLRRQRLAGVGAAAAVALTVGALAPQVTGGDRTAAPPVAVDPTTVVSEPPIPHTYDAERMPELLEQRSRDAFGSQASGLGPASFSAYAESGAALEAGQYDRAAEMFLGYDSDPQHSWDLSLMYAGSEVEGPRGEERCRVERNLGGRCEVLTSPDGHTSEVLTRALVHRHGVWKLVSLDRADSIDPDRLYFEREVELPKSDLFLVRVREVVRAPTLQQAEESFEVAPDTMVELAADPDLVLPLPDDYGKSHQRDAVSVPPR